MRRRRHALPRPGAPTLSVGTFALPFAPQALCLPEYIHNNTDYFSSTKLEHPFCVTVLSTPSGSTLTGFVCGNNVFRGTQYITKTPVFAAAGSSTSPSSPSTTTTSTMITPTETSVPVGAIVGGSIGGFAVLALIGFVMFFILIRAKRRNSAPQPEAPPQPSVADKAQYSHSQSPSLPGYDFGSSIARPPQAYVHHHHQPALASGGANSPQLRQPSFAGTSDRLPSPTMPLQMQQHPSAGAAYHLLPREGAMYAAPANAPPGPPYGAAGYPGLAAAVDPDVRELHG